MSNLITEIFTTPDFPIINDLPWDLPLVSWPKDKYHFEKIDHGITRHLIKFIAFGNGLYVIKEFAKNTAKLEFDLLHQMSEVNLPSVKPIGYVTIKSNVVESSYLITQFLESSLPYLSLFTRKTIAQYQPHLMTAISGLLVQLHANGFYWGDCSLSNILFRRDAGTLQAYLVDAETAEHHLPPLSPILRYHDIEIMQENIFSELSDLQTSYKLDFSYPIKQTGPFIQQNYRSLWEEITREDIFLDNELFRIEERIRKINSLGFSVKDIELKNEEQGNILKLRIFVSDRNFHRNQLLKYTGLRAEDRQAQQIMNEIYELKANFSHSENSHMDLNEVAEYWNENIFQPVSDKLELLRINTDNSPIKADIFELYCQVLEHKWYLSERAHHDVGHQVAVDDFILQYNKFYPLVSTHETE